MGTYTLFRILDDETVVVMLNKNEKPMMIDLKRFEEVGLAGKTLTNVITGEDFKWNDDITFKIKGVTILTTKKQ